MLNNLVISLLVALLLASTVGASLRRRSSIQHTFVSKRTRGNVEIVQLPASQNHHEYPDSFFQHWYATFPSDHSLFQLNSSENPNDTNEVITQAFCFCLLEGQRYGFLPVALISKLQKLPYNPDTPCALVIRGLPLDRLHTIPPSPVVESNSRANRIQPSMCPVAETILLGIARLLGIPHGAPTPARSNVIRDLSSEKREIDDSPLPMHRDFPRRTLGLKWEPEFLVMMSVRAGCPSQQASTTVTDCRQLYQKMRKTDRRLLIEHRLQIKTEKEGIAIGEPFYAIELDEDSASSTPKLNMFQAPSCLVHCADADGDVPLQNRVVQAYNRLCALAEETREEIALQPGDMLILNNARCVHGRTSLNNKFDGTDRWLIKTYVSNGLWRKPGQVNSSEEPSCFPNFDFPN